MVLSGEGLSNGAASGIVAIGGDRTLSGESSAILLQSGSAVGSGSSSVSIEEVLVGSSGRGIEPEQWRLICEQRRHH